MKSVLVTSEEKKCQKAAVQDLFGYLHKRMKVSKQWSDDID